MIIEFKFTSQQSNIAISELTAYDAALQSIPLPDLTLAVGTLVSGTSTSGVFNTDATGLLRFSGPNTPTVYSLSAKSTSILYMLSFLNDSQYAYDNISVRYKNGSYVFENLGDTGEVLDFFSGINTSLYDPIGFSFNWKSSSFADAQGVTRYGMVDDTGINYYNITTYTNINAEEWVTVDLLPRDMYDSSDSKSSKLRLKFLSSLANLYDQQAPSVVGIEVAVVSDVYMKVIATLDKAAQCAVYGLNLSASNTEGTLAFYARDEKAASLVHEYTVKKPIGAFKVVALATTNSIAKDFDNKQVPASAIGSYSYSVAASVESRYQEGYDLGYKDAHQQIYSRGIPYGWNFDFQNDTTYAAKQQLFVDTIADGQYLKAYREVYDRGASYGFTYNAASTDRSYYLGLRDAFASALGSSGSIETYNRVYPRGAAYGFVYTNTSTDKSYYQNLEASFINAVNSSGDSTGYKRAYGEIYAEGVTYQQLRGVPEGYQGFVNDTATNANFASKKGEFVRSMYNSGFLKSAQVVFDLGVPYDYNFRSRLSPNLHALPSNTVTAYYNDEFSNFVSTVVASSQIDGYVDVYNQIASTAGWSFDAQGTKTVVDYRDYLASQKTPAISALSNKSKIEAYEDVFSKALGDYGFTYTASTTASVYSNKTDSMLGAIYRRGLTSGVQAVYDKAIPYGVLTRTTYGTIKTASPLVTKALNPSTQALLAVGEPVYDVVFNDGIVSEARKLYNYATPYGFIFNNTSKDKEYYFGLEQNYVDSFTSGAETSGIRRVFQEANTRFGFTYANSNVVSQMSAQITPMFDFVSNSIGAEALRGIFNIGRDVYGVPYTNSTAYLNLTAQSETMLSSIQKQGAVEAYHYIFQQANVRDTYPYTGITNSVDMKSKVIPMFTWVEDYKESDGYRRVHNYARNFLGLDYTFQDSPNPRILENQVPNMFEYLSDYGGMGNLRYVLNTATQRYPGFAYQDNKTVTGLKSQIIPMFNFIDSTTIDIVSVEGPIFTLPDITKMKVVLKTPMKIYCVVSNIISGELLAFYLSVESLLVHNITLRLRPDQFGPNTKIVFIPAERISN